jgi:membrane-bound lytic murein transglycosylase D
MNSIKPAAPEAALSLGKATGKWILLAAFILLHGCATLAPEEEVPPYSGLAAETDVTLWQPPSLHSLPSYPPQPLPAQAAPKPDIWERIRAGYGLLPGLADKKELYESMQRYMKYADYFARISEQARPYLHYIVTEVERRGMPLELVLLPAVESAYRPEANSPKAAAGLWQLMPGTGKHFGLKQNAWYDGRRDVQASTEAALDYLQRLHNYFGGDWFHAIAAYNCGEGTLQKALNKNLDAGKPTDFWELDLPEETREFVPRLLAYSAMLAEPERYGIELPEIANEPYLQAVSVGGQIDLNLAAKLAELPLNDLRRLNPAFKRTATCPEGPHMLLLPIGKAEVFTRRLIQMEPHELVVEVDEPPEAEAPELQSHTIRKSDTLSKIAKAYGISVDRLCQLNGIKKNAKLAVGKKLSVPKKASGASTRVAKNSKTGKDAKKPDKADKAAKNPKKQSYTVKSGDTLDKIARVHAVSVAELKQWNKLGSHRLKSGQQLVILRK